MTEEIKTNIQFDVSDLKDAIDGLNSSVEDLVDKLGSDFISRVEKGSSSLRDSFKGAAEAAKDMSKEIKSSSDEQEKELKSLSQKYDQWLSELKKKGGIGGAMAEGMPQQITGFQSSIQTFKQSILSELPFGGLIGLALLGGKREQEVFAAGATAAREFEKAGGVASEQMSRVGNDIRRLGVQLGKGPTGLAGEFAAASAAFAQGGVDIKTVLEEKFDTPIKHSRGSLLETSIALDSLFKQGAGTAARQMTSMIRDFNLSAKESANVVTAIGLSARDSGTSVQAFTESVMRSATALRTQRVDITEVAQAQLKFQQILEQSMPGTSQQFRAGYAERAIGQVTQGLAGMNVGLSAVLGERISARTDLTSGKQVTGLEAHYAMREGFAGRGQTTKEAGAFEESIRELVLLAKEGDRSKEEQRFFLEKMGFGFEGSKALVDIGAELGKNADISKAISKHQEALRDAFVDRAKEQTDLTKSLIKIQDGVAKIGLGILEAIISGFQIIYHAISLAVMKFKGGNEVEQEVHSRMLAQAIKSAEKAQNTTVKGFETAVGGVKIGGKSLLSAGGALTGTSEEEMRKQIRKEKGIVADIGGVGYTASESKDIKKRADELIKMRASAEIYEELKRAGLEGPGVFGASEEFQELTSAYASGGSSKFKEVGEKLSKEGRLPQKSGRYVPEIAADMERTVKRQTMNVGGQKVTLQLASELTVVGQESESKGLAD